MRHRRPDWLGLSIVLGGYAFLLACGVGLVWMHA